ncbi:MAG: GGDEF domain-containing protein [Candidatus Eremiobacteraeota bacterium]|nr:GGDEF domain-containing protein [Candidatus Eremiobacteraeota bacterium]
MSASEKSSQTPGIVEKILDESARQVERRIALFRGALALLFLGLHVDDIGLAFGGAPPAGFGWLLGGVGLAGVYSLVVIALIDRDPNLPAAPLAYASVGFDAILLSLPVMVFFSTPQADHQMVLQGPGVAGLYMLIIAAGMRFGEATRFGIMVNSGVLLCYMGFDAVRVSQLPVADFSHIRSHAMLLIGSAILGQMISTQIRQTVHATAERALEATTDGLTGVWNRRHLRELLESSVAKARQEHTSLSVLMLDVDHFKQVNDQHGHQQGDRVLAEVAGLISSNARLDDSLARYGGEEFCLLLRQTNLEAALAVAERIRASIERNQVAGLNVTISIGAAQLAEGQEINHWLEAADQALYRAKAKGRNRVEPADRELATA